MLHTYYYVNGQRVSMERYVAASENKAYMEAAFKKAKDYFERREGEWFMLCASTPEDMLPLAMVTHFERTPDGVNFQKEWKAKQNRLHSWMLNHSRCNNYWYICSYFWT